jgi:hypothetical protein
MPEALLHPSDAGLAVPTLALDPLDAEPEDADEEDTDDSEAESAQGPISPSDGGLLYTADLSDSALADRWVKELDSLGSISVGFVESGRMINGVQLQSGDSWLVVDPAGSWGTQEMVDSIITVARAIREQFPEAPLLRVNHLSKKEGGHLRPHRSHQAGRDVDLGFFYQGNGGRKAPIDVAKNWFMLKALVTLTDVQMVLADRRVQKVLYQYALSQGEDKTWLDRLFHAGKASMVLHAPRHRDHFHVRFYAGRSQELGRRIQPLLAQRPEENVIMHRVKKGDLLGRIAQRYGSTVRLIQKANHLNGTFLSIGRSLRVPLRGPCTQCPLPPPVRVPPRLLPPTPATAGISAG